MMKVGDGAGAGVRTGGIVGRRIRNEFKQQQSVHRPLESFLFSSEMVGALLNGADGRANASLLGGGIRPF